jgi:nitrite reductase/ring-hydroxylating ferredoxin subunit
MHAPPEAVERLARLCRASDLPEGRSRGFDPTATGRDTLFVVRRNGVHAWRNACPHWADTPMAWRKDAYLNADATRIVCAAHGAQFEIATGLCTLGPCVGQSLTPVALVAADDGMLSADIAFLENST